MSLCGSLDVNGTLIGWWTARRQPDNHGTEDDPVYDYDATVQIHGSAMTLAVVRHRYSDGATVLAAKALISHNGGCVAPYRVDFHGDPS